MLDNNNELGLTKAKNRRHPELSDVMNWLDESWKGLSMEGVKKKAKELGMFAEPGPPVPGYVDKLAENLYKIEEDGSLIEPKGEEDANICNIKMEEEDEFELEEDKEF